MTQALSVIDADLTLKSYFRLRAEIVHGMPWTFSNLCPLILPFIVGERVPGNGTIAAMIQASGFNIIVSREVQQGNDDSFSVTSPFCPNKTFPFGAAEAAVLELEGAGRLKVKRYDTISDIDRCLQNIGAALQRRLSDGLLVETIARIELILREGR
jgi:hypothetical protein